MLLDVLEVGEKEGTPLVVLPSMGLTHRPMTAVFEPVLRSVPACRRLYVGLPGTDGAPLTAPSSEAVLAAVVDTVTDRLGESPFLVAGWSYGGYLAAALARRLGNRVQGLFVVCAGPKISPEDRDLTGVQPSTEEAGWLAAVPAELHDYFRLAVGHQSREVMARITAVLAAIGTRDQAFLERLRAEAFALADEEATFTYDGPVTFLCGRRDRVAGFAATIGSLGHYPDADLTLLAAAGHFLPLEEPDRFRASLGAWLRRCGLLLGAPSRT